MFRHKETGEVLSKLQIRHLYPSVSFPKYDEDWKGEVLEFANVEVIVDDGKPEDTDDLIYIDDGIENIDGVWKQKWSAQARYTEEELAAIEEAEKINWKNSFDESVKKKISEITDKVTRHEDLKKLGKKPFEVDGIYTDDFILQVLAYKEELRAFLDNVDPDNVEWPRDPFDYILSVKSDYDSAVYAASVTQEVKEEKIATSLSNLNSM